MYNAILSPGLTLGSYPQKKPSRLTDIEQSATRWSQYLQYKLNPQHYTQKNVLKKINQHQVALEKCSETDLTESIDELRLQLHKQGLQPELIIKSFAIIRETAHRTLGQRHFNVQLYGGWLMINGVLAEMETGEGKTLATTLPSCTAALAGIPVHVITTNEYLASRDAENMQPLYQRLGLTSGAVFGQMETDQRRAVYQHNIVHTSNKQIAFDYLRDRIEMGDNTGHLSTQFQQIRRRNQKVPSLLLRGLCFALVDEADSILIDEAKVPLIITKTITHSDSPKTFSEALFLASSLIINQDFISNNKSRTLELTIKGEQKLENLIVTLPKQWRNKRKRESLVKQALIAEHLFKKDQHYVVNEEKVTIVDEFTGRTMPDRSWEQGLHQMIETKEGCLITQQREPLARISYQQFFSRYLKLGGTSGTLSEVSDELYRVYGLNVAKVATNCPSIRKFQDETVYRTQEIQRQVLINKVKTLYHQHRPVLIGTRSVEKSEQISQWLEDAHFPFRILNAKQDKNEAQIIAQAGLAQSITIATNMAGRGTDIQLGSDIAEIGGLHVISLSLNDSRRIARQLYGRCARQGDPGSVEAILTLQDPYLEEYYSSAMLNLLATCCHDDRPMPNFMAKIMLWLMQYSKEKQQQKVRTLLIKQDKHLQRILAFSGKFE